MNASAPSPGKPGLQEQILARLRHPVQLRLAVCGALLGAWYAGVQMPLADQIVGSQAQADSERARVALAGQIEDLRREAGAFAGRLPESADPNDFFRYMLDGIRSQPVKLIKINPAPSRAFGPFKLLEFRISVEGRYRGLAALIRWIEENPRLLRIDNLRIDPKNQDDQLTAQLTVIGLSK